MKMPRDKLRRQVHTMTLFVLRDFSYYYYFFELFLELLKIKPEFLMIIYEFPRNNTPAWYIY